VHVVILNICIAMSSLQLPNYVLLEIIDWLPYYEAAISHLKKIRLIEAANRSISRLKGNVCFDFSNCVLSCGLNRAKKGANLELNTCRKFSSMIESFISSMIETFISSMINLSFLK
jgi:hypothetical protein